MYAQELYKQYLAIKIEMFVRWWGAGGGGGGGGRF